MAFTTWFVRYLGEVLQENKVKSHINCDCETKEGKRGSWQSTSLLVPHCVAHDQDTLPLIPMNTFKINGQL